MAQADDQVVITVTLDDGRTAEVVLVRKPKPAQPENSEE